MPIPSCVDTTVLVLYILVPECLAPYKYNPHSWTCVRFVYEKKVWTEAKEYCESDGEHLVTFRNQKALEWLIKEIREANGNNLSKVFYNNICSACKGVC